MNCNYHYICLDAFLIIFNLNKCQIYTQVINEQCLPFTQCLNTTFLIIGLNMVKVYKHCDYLKTDELNTRDQKCCLIKAGTSDTEQILRNVTINR